MGLLQAKKPLSQLPKCQRGSELGKARGQGLGLEPSPCLPVSSQCLILSSWEASDWPVDIEENKKIIKLVLKGTLVSVIIPTSL